MRWKGGPDKWEECHCKCAYVLQTEGKMDSKEMPAIAFAAVLGHDICLQTLVEAGADVNMKNEGGTSPLMYAASTAHNECLTMLLKEGANVNLTNEVNLTALYFACDVSYTAVQYKKNNHSECIKSLIEAGADVNIASSEYGTPLLKAAECTSGDNCVKMLLQAGAEINPTIPPDMFLGPKKPLTMAVSQGNDKNVKLLIEAGADVNYKSEADDEQPPLLIATENEEPSTVKLLLSAGADVNISYGGQTALYMVREAESLRLLLKAGATVNTPALAYSALMQQIVDMICNKIDITDVCLLLLAAGEKLDGTTVTPPVPIFTV